ncbi:MAG: hypothetical protein WBA16_04975 [Nonlabens sp.]
MMRHIRQLLILILVLVISSCAFFDMRELRRVEGIGLEIQDQFNSADVASIVATFSVARFSKRLGYSFRDLPNDFKREGYQFFHQIFADEVKGIVNALAMNDLSINFLEAHKKDGVYRLNYEISVLKNGEPYVTNFLVIYLQQDSNEEFKIVNLYNLQSGFSMGQIGKNNVNDMLTRKNSESYTPQANLLRSFAIKDEAQKKLAYGDAMGAYNLIETIPKSLQDAPRLAAWRLYLASQINEKLYRDNLVRMKSISPNKQSIKFYDCQILGIDRDSTATQVCYDELYEMLFEM